MDEAFYPIVGAESNLPVCVYGIGWCEYQYHVVRPEGFPIPQINYCAGGEGVLKFDGQTYEIKQGVSFFMPENYPHEYYTKKDLWRNDWISFGGKHYHSVLKELNLTKPIVVNHHHEDKLTSCWMEIYQCLKEETLIGNMLASGHLYKYLVEYMTQYKNSQVPQNSQHSEFNVVLEYINQHYMEELSLHELAALINITPQYLCKLFRQHLGMRPFQYITKRRMQEAKHLLLQNKYTTTEIAALVGYNDTSYFCRLFREAEQMTPSTFVAKSSQ